MKNITIKLISFMFFMLCWVHANSQETDNKINWVGFGEAYNMNQEEGRKFLVYIYSDNCGWCKKMVNETFSVPAVVDYINKHYYAIRLNANLKEEIRYGNRNFSYIPADPAKNLPGYHELILLLLEGRMAYPAIAFLDEELVFLELDRGYKSASPFREKLSAIAGN